MQVRKLNKAERIKAVQWIRSGAQVQEGIELYFELTGNQRGTTWLKNNIAIAPEHLKEAFCLLLGIPRLKYESIIKEYHGKEIKEVRLTGVQNTGIKKEPHSPRKRSFRSEWPFLSEKDCPEELKVLAADKITAWETYTARHRELYDCESIEDCTRVAGELIEAYQENRSIYAELDHYKKYKEPLGVHPIWKNRKRRKEINKLSVPEAFKLATKTLPHRIWRIESEIAKGDKPHLNAERKKRIEATKKELQELRKMLHLDE